MYKALSIILFLLFSLSIKAQPAYNLLATFNANNYVMTVDKAGNIYTGGYFSGVTDVDPGPGVFNLSGNTSQSCGHIIKTDSAGFFVWAKELKGSSTAYSMVKAITTDLNNNIFITGNFSDTIDFNPGTGVFNLIGAIGASSVFMMKLDSNGNFIWAKKVTNGGTSNSCSILAGKTGNIYLFGQFQGTVDMDPGINFFNLTANGDDDIFITKLDSIGNFLWSKKIGGIYTDWIITAKLDKKENLYYAGSYYGTVDFDPGSSIYNLTTIGGYECMYISKLDSLGVFQWAKSAGGTDGSRICDIELDSLSNIYMTGYFGGTIDFDFGLGTYNVNSAGMIDAFVMKMDSVCNLSWVSHFGGVNNDGGSSIALDKYGNVYMVGNFFGSCNFWLTSGTFYLYSQSGSTWPDQIFLKLDNSGNMIWKKTLSGSAQRTIYAVRVTQHNSLVVSGTFSNGNVVFDGCLNTITSSSNLTALLLEILTANPLLPNDITLASDKNKCVGSSVTLTVSAIDVVNWYSSQTGIVSIANGNHFNATGLSAGTYTYYASATSCSGNASPRIAITITISPNCQDVWPGDANSDGTADNLDVLELGLHFTQTGPARTSTSNVWQSYVSNNWIGTITNGKNVNHSDCNGDGVIDANDTLAIYTNYGLTHAFKPTQQSVVNPQLSIVPDQAFVNKGDWGTASVFLGEASIPVTNVNGIAFTLDFDHTVLETNSVWMEYPVSFMDNGQSLHFRKVDFLNGKLYAATTHTTSANVNGNGKIAVLHYRIKSALATDATLNFAISQAYKSNASGVIDPITAGTASVMAVGASVGLNELASGSYVSVYPNPAVNEVMISSGIAIDHIEVTTVTGQLLFKANVNATTYVMNTSALSNGIYFIAVSSNGVGTTIKKLVIQK